MNCFSSCLLGFLCVFLWKINFNYFFLPGNRHRASLPPDGTTFSHLALGELQKKTIPSYSYWNFQVYTVPTHINLRRFIKIWGFQGGGLLKILPIKASKSLKKWTFGPKQWRFIQILLYWRFNQEWSFICVDTVVHIWIMNNTDSCNI